MKLSSQARWVVASVVLTLGLLGAVVVYAVPIVTGPTAEQSAPTTTTTSTTPPPDRPASEAVPFAEAVQTGEINPESSTQELAEAAKAFGAPVLVPEDYQFSSGRSAVAPTWKDLALPMRAPNVGECDINGAPEFAAERASMHANGEITDQVFWLDYLTVKVPVSYVHGPFAVDTNLDRHFVDCYSNTIEGAVIAALHIIARDSWIPDNAFNAAVSYSAVPNEGRTNRIVNRPDETAAIISAAAQSGLVIQERAALAHKEVVCAPIGHVGSQAEQSVIVWILQECPTDNGIVRQVLVCDMSFEDNTWKIVYPEVIEKDGSLSFPPLCTPRLEDPSEKEADLWYYWPEESLLS